MVSVVLILGILLVSVKCNPFVVLLNVLLLLDLHLALMMSVSLEPLWSLDVPLV